MVISGDFIIFRVHNLLNFKARPIFLVILQVRLGLKKWLRKNVLDQLRLDRVRSLFSAF